MCVNKEQNVEMHSLAFSVIGLEIPLLNRALVVSIYLFIYLFFILFLFLFLYLRI